MRPSRNRRLRGSFGQTSEGAELVGNLVRSEQGIWGAKGVPPGRRLANMDLTRSSRPTILSAILFEVSVMLPAMRWLIAGLALVGLGLPAATAGEKRPPNVILIVADDL